MNLQGNSMTSTRNAEQAKQESERTVIRELVKKSPQRWSNLLASTKISSRTLKNTLMRLEEKGAVYRRVEQGKEYPPPVFYGLSSEGKEIGDPMLFALNVWPYVLGLRFDWKAVGPKEVSIGIVIKTKDKKQRIASLGRRLSALCLFALLQTFKEQNTDWLLEARNLLNYDPFTVMTLDLDNLKIKTEGRVERLGGQNFLALPQNLEFDYTVKKEKIEELEKILKEVYAEEIQAFERVLKKIKTTQKDK